MNDNPAAGLSARLRPSLKGTGPKPATIMIVGEAPFGQDMIKLEVFSSNGGEELTRMLHEAGIIRADCYLTNVIKVQPHGNKVEEFYLDKKCTKPNVVLKNYFEQLAVEVAEVNPTLIIALGNTALLALTGKTGVSKWRGSMLTSLPSFGNRKVIPTYHPAAVIKNWEWRPIVMQDLRRAVHESATATYSKPAWNFTIRPSFPRVMVTLQELSAKAEAGALKLSVDIETRSAQIACIGIAWSRLDAICIPLMAIKGPNGSYWTEDEELAIRRKIRSLLAHPNVEVIGQNFGYDSQYFAFQDGMKPRVRFDTMLMHHTLFNQMKKSLDFMASLYCGYYVYWKDDGKTWDASIDEEQYWVYNCEDTVYTYELSEVLDRMLTREGLQEQYSFLLELWSAVMTIMIRGTRVDEKAKSAVAMELMLYMAKVQQEIDFLCDQPLNIASPKQVSELFYGQLGMQIVKNVKTKQPTTDDTALTLFAKREPLVMGLCERIAAMRSAGVLLSTFALMPLDADKRMRCYYNVAGTDTYRFNSKENAFGNGGNLQNLPKGDDEDALEKKRAYAAKGHTILEVPNIRKLYIPDPGKTFFDIDLDRADLMVVIAEADDLDLFQAVKEGVDLHRFNASALFNCPMDRVTDKQRQAAKMFAHGTNYGGSARTMAINCGLTVHESERMQNNWFAAHPGIKDWHRRTEAQLQSRREVRNAFGFRSKFFGRVEALLPEALAWIPQSTVSIVINKGLLAVHQQMPNLVDINLQVHDSIAGQYATHMEAPILRQMKPLLEIIVPYAKPLIIGVGIKTSTKSWGEVEEKAWPEPLAV